MVQVFVQDAGAAALPLYATAGSAGMDIRVAEDCKLWPGASAAFATGLKLAIPEGYELQIRPRSGLSLKTTLRLPNSPGTIDSDYRDELRILVHNQFSMADVPWRLLAHPEERAELLETLSYGEFFERIGQRVDWPADLLAERLYLNRQGDPFGTLYFQKGERIAQMVLARYEQIAWEPCDDVKAIGSDRGGGFGSTGR